MKNDQDDVPTATVGVWIGLIVTAALSFWSQAAVTEERFVPALNLISTKYAIPNAVAGATLMAAGCSSPELFSSFVSLFITKSSLGLGTIVGSEIFNQLVSARHAYTHTATQKSPTPLFLFLSSYITTMSNRCALDHLRRCCLCLQDGTIGIGSRRGHSRGFLLCARHLTLVLGLARYASSPRRPGRTHFYFLW